MMSKGEDSSGHIGDDAGKHQVFTHDQLKKRCQLFLAKLILNHSPKEISNYLFELIYSVNNGNGDKRLDIVLKEFDDEWHSNEKEKED